MKQMIKNTTDEYINKVAPILIDIFETEKYKLNGYNTFEDAIEATLYISKEDVYYIMFLYYRLQVNTSVDYDYLRIFKICGEIQ